MAVTIAPPGGTVTVTTPKWSVAAIGQVYEIGVIADVAVMPAYQGAYEVTPGDEPQTLHTNGLMMDRDLTVGAIPSNYGLITYDGSTITVS